MPAGFSQGAQMLRRKCTISLAWIYQHAGRCFVLFGAVFETKSQAALYKSKSVWVKKKKFAACFVMHSPRISLLVQDVFPARALAVVSFSVTLVVAWVGVPPLGDLHFKNTTSGAVSGEQGNSAQ